MRNFLLAGVTFVLAGCGLIQASEPPGPYPTDYKATIAAYVRENFFDPYSLRGVAIATPKPGVLAYTSGWLVCFQANAKNRMGGYVGLGNTGYLIKNGKVEVAIKGASDCDNDVYWPWLEMDNRGGGNKT